MQRIVPAAATVRLPVIWRLGGECVAFLLATSYLKVMCMWVAAERDEFMGILETVLSREVLFSVQSHGIKHKKTTCKKCLLHKINKTWEAVGGFTSTELWPAVTSGHRFPLKYNDVVPATLCTVHTNSEIHIPSCNYQ